MIQTEVLIAGAGPVGLTAAIELARRGIALRIVDPLREPPPYAKAVGIQPRTLEVFEGMGVLRHVLDGGIQMRGQISYVNGAKVGQMDIVAPLDVPFGFLAIPQYVTERILRDELAHHGVHVDRGVRVTAFAQDSDGVTATVDGEAGPQTVRASYLIGTDGAHSAVRKGLGTTFEGGAFEEQYMLGDVEVDWSLPAGYGVRAVHQTDGTTDDLLVCIPLPGHRRYRMSMLVPDELASASRSPDGITHGFEAGRTPDLSHLQAVLDRLSPEPTTAGSLRWSSVFRISHRIAGSYGSGRVFIAGDAAHVHPPTGAQGMNTGIQDAHNLAWKVALAVRGHAATGLLDSYDAERRPVGEDVVGRTVRSAREGIGADATDPDYVIRREAQLLIDYVGSPIVSDGAGRRAPDATGLTRDVVTGSLRLFDLLGSRDHTLLLYLGADAGPEHVRQVEAVAEAAVAAAHERMDAYLVVGPGVDLEVASAATLLPVIRDARGEFAAAYGVTDAGTFVVRPDGYLGFASTKPSSGDEVTRYLRTTFQ